MTESTADAAPLAAALSRVEDILWDEVEYSGADEDYFRKLAVKIVSAVRQASPRPQTSSQLDDATQ